MTRNCVLEINRCHLIATKSKKKIQNIKTTTSSKDLRASSKNWKRHLKDGIAYRTVTICLSSKILYHHCWARSFTKPLPEPIIYNRLLIKSLFNVGTKSGIISSESIQHRNKVLENLQIDFAIRTTYSYLKISKRKWTMIL